MHPAIGTCLGILIVDLIVVVVEDTHVYCMAAL